MNTDSLVAILYLISAASFIFGIKRMTRVPTARSGNQLAALAMLIAVVVTFIEIGSVDYTWIAAGLALGSIIGAFAALRVPMTSMPEMVALLNGTGGASSMFVALAAFWGAIPMMTALTDANQDGAPAAVLGVEGGVTIPLSILIGAITLTGSLIAWAKLQGKLKNGQPIMLPGRHVLNGLLVVGALGALVYFAGFAPDAQLGVYSILALAGLGLILGITLVIPIGGADMPVVVSLLNSYSGLAAAAAGFVVGNPLLIIGGSMVGAAGIILTQIMCVAMNRSLVSVLLGGFGMEATGGGGADEYTNVKQTGAAEAGMELEMADSVCIVPGYGLAVAQAQHTLRELANELESRGVEVTYAIHPVAGRMPGHMNVLLAEADVPYEQLIDLEQANSNFRNVDVTIVLGANDVVNPAALTDETSPIYGMPILHAHESGRIFIIKRSLSPGYAGIANPLFEHERANMVFGDAKKVLEEMLSELKESR